MTGVTLQLRMTDVYNHQDALVFEHAYIYSKISLAVALQCVIYIYICALLRCGDSVASLQAIPSL